ncbi:MAG: Gfo/Idh/MocA family oxidoreductase [Clostridiaceae bacterium]|nr:Gfo/Idh/MocA family oxidoreductase [Clostridiales bacterium]MDD6878330.1 Gfo/Idh/MocA family oxidoreductase [Clostridiaceae bacterium]MDY3072051.1 Gfo/Idh/MocA family oxidoreductase [Eubacteriales bacterium]MDY3286068.1 Gfo/Idh/MocA family oxidoreductase [Eubacteriales bacterium]
MDKNNIGYAVLGLGIGSSHVKGTAELRGGRLVAICDLKTDRLEKVSSELAAEGVTVKTYTNYAEMLRDPEIDAVSIATPSGMHAEHAIMAMRAGKHVLIEKPIDVSVARAEEIVRVWKMSGVKASCVFQCRRWPCVDEIRRVLAEGKLGDVFSGFFRVNWNRSDEYFAGATIASGEAWRGTWAWDGGGSLMNQGVHTADLMQWLMGGVESVTSVTKIFNHSIETEDFTSSIVKFKNGAIGNLVSTTCNGGKTSTDVQIFGTKGSIAMDAGKITSWVVPGEDEAEMIARYADGGAAVTKNAAAATGHAFHIQDLVDAIREDRKPYIQPDEALDALKVVLAVYKSAREGREVFIREMD